MFFVWLQNTPAPLPTGYGAALLQTLVSLLAVCLLAWLLLRWGARRGFATGARGRRVKVIERVALDPRRTLYVVEVGGKVLLLGAGDGASPTLLSELDPKDFPAEPTAPKVRFAQTLAKLRGTTSTPATPVETDES
ncbi:MAG: flagellar biosynthetic protein FliO [Sandaracinus sp.]|nr:flagellar biosynthetic protein FliO [Sandaracinus sp.]